MHWTTLNCALSLALCSSAWSMQAPIQDTIPRQRMEAEARPQERIEVPGPAIDVEHMPLHLFEQEERIKQFDFVVLPELPSLPRDGFSFQLPLRGEWVTLELKAHTVRADGFQVLVQNESGELIRQGPSWSRTFEGRVHEFRDALVAGSLLTTGMEAVIAFPDGTVYGLQPHFESFLLGDRTRFILFDQSSTEDSQAAEDQEGMESLVHQELEPETMALDEQGGCGSTYCVAELALDLDYDFCQAYSANEDIVRDYAEAIVNVTNLPFQRDTNISHRVTSMTLRSFLSTEPPLYSSVTESVDMLHAMEEHWNTHHTDIPRDMAVLMTGRLTHGNAYKAAICEPTENGTGNGYAVHALVSLYLHFNSDLLAQKLGVAWNAKLGASPGYIMGTDVAGSLRFDPDDAQIRIRSFRNTRTCIDPGVLNDDLQSAIEICSSTFIGCTTGATVDGNQACWRWHPDGGDVWYVYTPGYSGTAEISTCASETDFDTIVSVHDRGIGTGSDQIACNDQYCGNASRLTFSAVAGSSYLIRVAGWNGATGNFGLSLSGPVCDAPVNDDWQQAIHVGAGTYFGSTAAATSNWASPLDSGGVHKDLWYRHSGGYFHRVFDLSDTTPGTTLTVLAAEYNFTLDSALIVAFDIVQSDRTAQVHLPQSLGGNSFLVRVSAPDAAGGSFTLRMTGADPPNQNCQFRAPISDGLTVGELRGAYEDWSNWGCTTYSDYLPAMWFGYQSKVDGTLTVSTCGTHDFRFRDAGFEPILGLFEAPSSGSPCGFSSPIGCSVSSGGMCGSLDEGLLYDGYMEAPVEKEVYYMVRVGRLLAADYPGRFFLNMQVRPHNDDCAGATVVEEGQHFETLHGATNDGSAGCDAVGTTPDVWYLYEAPAAGTLHVTTCKTHDWGGTTIDEGTDTVLSVHSGCPGTSANQWACNDSSPLCGDEDVGAIRDSYVTLPISAGQQVWIRVAATGGTELGRFRLNLDLVEF